MTPDQENIEIWESYVNELHAFYFTAWKSLEVEKIFPMPKNAFKNTRRQVTMKRKEYVDLAKEKISREIHNAKYYLMTLKIKKEDQETIKTHLP